MSSFHLKLIAITAMLCDHIGVALFPGDIAWRIIGRVAFPVFCFLIAEGAAHTKNIEKYLFRLMFFAIIAEGPFDLMGKGKLFDAGSQNVFFTLSLGLIGICAVKYFAKRWYLWTVAVAALAGVAQIIRSDYRWYGVLMIVGFYLARDLKLARAGAFFIPTQLYALDRTFKLFRASPPPQGKLFLPYLFSDIQQNAVIGLVCILLYNGKRGYNRAWVKWGFYLFYPCHMLILYFIKILVFA